MKRQFSILLHLFLLLALSACGAARQPCRLPGQNEVKLLLAHLMDGENERTKGSILAPALLIPALHNDSLYPVLCDPGCFCLRLGPDMEEAARR